MSRPDRRTAALAAALRRHLRDHPVDIVHVHAPAPGVVARLVVHTLPRSTRPNIVTTEHNAVSTYRLPTRIANAVTSRGDQATITVSDEALQSLRGPARRRAVSLQHGVDVRGVAGQRVHRAQVRDEFGVASAFVIGTVANFRAQKDHPNLLQAIRLLHDRQVEVRVIAVGQGPLQTAVEAQATALEIDDIVTFTGFRADATAVMSGFDAFVLASSYEGLPVALMEALALGLPVVATAVGGVAEALVDDVDALLVAPSDPVALADALERVVADDGLRARLVAAGRRRADDFDIGRAVATIESIYADVVASTVPVTPASPASPVPPAASSAPEARRRSGLEIREATAADRPAMIEMLRGPLQWGDDPRNADFFAWKHDLNPFGPSPTWVAVHGDRIVAVRAFMRWQFERGRERIDAVRAVDTATDPAHQGRGLFRELTMHAIDVLREQGVSFVFNTPNEQSRPGYLSMGWHDVGRLPAAVIPRLGRLATTIRARVPADRWSAPLQVGGQVGVSIDEWLGLGGIERWHLDRRPDRELVTPLTEAFVRWRFGSPLLPYRVVDGGDCAIILRARERGAARELVIARTFGDERRADRLTRRTLAAAGCDHALRLGPAHPLHGSLPMPGAGPTLTWRSLADQGRPPLANWHLSLGDIELL